MRLVPGLVPLGSGLVLRGFLSKNMLFQYLRVVHHFLLLIHALVHAILLWEPIWELRMGLVPGLVPLGSGLVLRGFLSKSVVFLN